MSEKNFEEIPNRKDTLEFRMYILKELIALKNNHEENKDFETFHHLGDIFGIEKLSNSEFKIVADTFKKYDFRKENLGKMVKEFDSFNLNISHSELLTISLKSNTSENIIYSIKVKKYKGV